jgi:AcrR family transcriptional regulator
VTRERKIRGLDAEERRQQRRRQLLDAAFELFGSDGYAATSIEAVCQQAYVSTKSFYEIFPNKEALYIALNEELATELLKHLLAASDVVSDDPFDTVKRILSSVTHGFLDDPRVARVLFIEGTGISAQVDEHRWTNRRQAAVALGQAWLRLVPDPTPEQTAMFLGHRFACGVIGAFCDMLIDWLNDPSDDDIDRLVDDLVAFFDVTHRGVLCLPAVN